MCVGTPFYGCRCNRSAGPHSIRWLTNAVVSVVVDRVSDDLDVVAVVVGVEAVLVVVVNVVVLPFAPVVCPGIVPEPLHIVGRGKGKHECTTRWPHGHSRL